MKNADLLEIDQICFFKPDLSVEILFKGGHKSNQTVESNLAKGCKI